MDPIILLGLLTQILKILSISPFISLMMVVLVGFMKTLDTLMDPINGMFPLLQKEKNIKSKL